MILCNNNKKKSHLVHVNSVLNEFSFAVGPPYCLHFRVKFYSSEPNNLREELTRWDGFCKGDSHESLKKAREVWLWGISLDNYAVLWRTA